MSHSRSIELSAFLKRTVTGLKISSSKQLHFQANLLGVKEAPELDEELLALLNDDDGKEANNQISTTRKPNKKTKYLLDKASGERTSHGSNTFSSGNDCDYEPEEHCEEKNGSLVTALEKDNYEKKGLFKRSSHYNKSYKYGKESRLQEIFLQAFETDHEVTTILTRQKKW